MIAVDVVVISVGVEKDSAAWNYRKGGVCRRLRHHLLVLLLYNLLLACNWQAGYWSTIGRLVVCYWPAIGRVYLKDQSQIGHILDLYRPSAVYRLDLSTQFSRLFICNCAVCRLKFYNIEFPRSSRDLDNFVTKMRLHIKCGTINVQSSMFFL